MRSERFSANRTVFQKTELYSWVLKKADKRRKEEIRQEKKGCVSLASSL